MDNELYLKINLALVVALGVEGVLLEQAWAELVEAVLIQQYGH